MAARSSRPRYALLVVVLTVVLRALQCEGQSLTRGLTIATWKQAKEGRRKVRTEEDQDKTGSLRRGEANTRFSSKEKGNKSRENRTRKRCLLPCRVLALTPATGLSLLDVTGGLVRSFSQACGCLVDAACCGEPSGLNTRHQTRFRNVSVNPASAPTLSDPYRSFCCDPTNTCVRLW